MSASTLPGLCWPTTHTATLSKCRGTAIQSCPVSAWYPTLRHLPLSTLHTAQPDFIHAASLYQSLASRKLNQELLCRQDRASALSQVLRAYDPAEQNSLLQALQHSDLFLTSKTSPEGIPGRGDSRHISVAISFCFSHLNQPDGWQVHYTETTLQLSASSCWDIPYGNAQQVTTTPLLSRPLKGTWKTHIHKISPPLTVHIAAMRTVSLL